MFLLELKLTCAIVYFFLFFEVIQHISSKHHCKYARIAKIHPFFFCHPSERRLHSMNQLVDHPPGIQYFWPDRPIGPIQDDHIPFLNKGTTPTHTEVTSAPAVYCAALIILCLSGRCAHPPPYPFPLPVCMAHIR